MAKRMPHLTTCGEECMKLRAKLDSVDVQRLEANRRVVELQDVLAKATEERMRAQDYERLANDRANRCAWAGKQALEVKISELQAHLNRANAQLDAYANVLRAEMTTRHC